MGEDQVLWDRQDPADRRAFQDIPDHRVKQEPVSYTHLDVYKRQEECLLREAKEETGLTLTSWKFRGIVTFISEGWNTEYMCLYTADGYEGEIIPCNEGVLEWIRKEDLLKLNLWEGDKIFLKLLQENAPFFSLKLAYKGDVLTEAVLDGKKLKKS